MATDFAPVTPSVLRWARESIGASAADAAARAKVDTGRLTLWEAGQLEPTVAQLRSLAKFYQRPLSVFFLPEPPTDFMTLRDFRCLPDRSDHTWSRALHKVFRRALEQQDIYVELVDDDADRSVLLLPPASVDDDPEMTGAVARTALGVRLADQFGWDSADDAARGWTEAVEGAGVLVLRTSDVPTSEMRGFSISNGDVPVITVNALDAPRGQIFTLLHEYVHLMLRQNGLCDILEPESGDARRIEVFCNAAAGAALIPRDFFLDEPLVRDPGERTWTDVQLRELSLRYSVSREAVLRRLVTVGRASWDFYLTKRPEFLRAYDELRAEERERRRTRDKKGGPPPHRMAIRDRGRPFVRTVLDAYHRDAISASSVSAALGLRLKHLPAIEKEAGG